MGGSLQGEGTGEGNVDGLQGAGDGDDGIIINFDGEQSDALGVRLLQVGPT